MNGPDIALRSGSGPHTRAPVSISVPGRPVPKGSMRASLTRTGKIAVFDGNKALPEWSQTLAFHLAGLILIPGPVGVGLNFFLHKPQRKATLPDRKPDLDKLVRGVLDALVYAQVLEDDARVVELIATKEYGDIERVDIQIWPR